MDLSNLCVQFKSLATETGYFILNEQKRFSSDDIQAKGIHNYVTYVDTTSEEKLVKGLRLLLPEAGIHGHAQVREIAQLEKGQDLRIRQLRLDRSDELSAPLAHLGLILRKRLRFVMRRLRVLPRILPVQGREDEAPASAMRGTSARRHSLTTRPSSGRTIARVM